MRSRFVILTLLTTALFATAAEEGFERYQIIIDKSPFGEAPPEADAANRIPHNQSFAKDLRLTMLFEGPGGDIRVGVVDSKLKKNYLLKVGEIENGIALEGADIEKSEAMLRKGTEAVLLKLEEGAPEQLTQKQQRARSSNYAARRKAMLERVKEQKKKEQPAEPSLTGEELRKHLEEVQMDAIRTGKPPLPMPLTPEMDAQLVEEGFLPPQ